MRCHLQLSLRPFEFGLTEFAVMQLFRSSLLQCNRFSRFSTRPLSDLLTQISENDDEPFVPSAAPVLLDLMYKDKATKHHSVVAPTQDHPFSIAEFTSKPPNISPIPAPVVSSNPMITQLSVIGVDCFSVLALQLFGALVSGKLRGIIILTVDSSWLAAMPTLQHYAQSQSQTTATEDAEPTVKKPRIRRRLAKPKATPETDSETAPSTPLEPKSEPAPSDPIKTDDAVVRLSCDRLLVAMTTLYRESAGHLSKMPGNVSLHSLFLRNSFSTVHLSFSFSLSSSQFSISALGSSDRC